VAGTGLGLSVSYGIVQAHGGRLLVESELGVGSLFTVILARASAAGEPPPAVAPPIATPAKRHILVVDDEPHVRSALARLLTRAGHVVEQASDGHEAVARSSYEHWDVIISDVTMPTLDGPSMIAQLRAAGQLTPVVLMTGRVDTAAMALAQSSSATVVLEKPFDQRALLDAIARAVEQAQ
jgi:CheY-like chemotaxis protein